MSLPGQPGPDRQDKFVPETEAGQMKKISLGRPPPNNSFNQTILNMIYFALLSFEAQGSGDDTSMNGISFTCASGPSFNFDGNWGFWEGWSHTCSGGFTAAMVKMEGKQVK